MTTSRTLTDEQNVLLVIAHPDDEAMFFVPTILSLRRAGRNVFVLCLSTGDYIAGQGAVRERELADSCRALGIADGHVAVARNALPDGPQHHWSQAAIADELDAHLDHVQRQHRLDIGAVVSFDEMGVSGHANHVAIYAGLVFWRARTTFRTAAEPVRAPQPRADIACWKLKTVPLLRKYSALLDLLISWITSAGLVFFFYPLAFFAVWSAMRAHRSQFVWFRVLFVIFSRYSYMNTLERVF